MAVLGHVDSGKTSLLDKIRGTGVQGREAGGITQHIGASFLPDETIQKLCGALYEKLGKTENKVPGILVIDTPGHEVFTNLRARGGSAADIAILVVDINRGFQPQTNESLKILESRKVPFVVALNKVDMISGWQQSDDAYISKAIKKQSPSIQTNIDEQIYNVVGALSILGYQSEAFYRVQDFKKEISIVPVSARSGVGIPELLAVLVGLTQQFLSKKLEQEEKPTRGIVLEVNDEVGLGPTANMILIDGHLKKDDNVVVAKRDSVIADIGPVTRRDIMQAKAIKDKDRHLGVVLAFNVKIFDDAKTECDESHIRVFEDKVIYSLIDTYSQWVDDDKADLENSIFKEFTPISKFTFLKGYAFRNNNPAVFGIRVDVGTLRQKIAFTNKSGKKIGNIHSLEADGKTVQEVKSGEEVACSVQNVTIGRQINEEDVFYTLPTPSEAKQLLKKYAHKLSSEELETLNEIVSIQRETNPVYGY